MPTWMATCAASCDSSKAERQGPDLLPPGFPALPGLSTDLSATPRLQPGLSTFTLVLLRISKGRKTVIWHCHAWLSLLICAGFGMAGWTIPAAGQTSATAAQAAVDSAKSNEDGALPPSPPPRPNETNTRGYVVGDGGVARAHPAPAPGENAGPAGEQSDALPEGSDATRSDAAGDSRARAGQRSRDQQATAPATPPIGVNEPGVNRARPPR
jgi:hypothetical protein